MLPYLDQHSHSDTEQPSKCASHKQKKGDYTSEYPLKSSLVIMLKQVRSEVCPLNIRLRTERALMWPLTRVGPQVTSQCGLLCEASRTYVALIWPLTRVCVPVDLQCGLQ